MIFCFSDFQLNFSDRFQLYPLELTNHYFDKSEFQGLKSRRQVDNGDISNVTTGATTEIIDTNDEDDTTIPDDKDTTTVTDSQVRLVRNQGLEF